MIKEALQYIVGLSEAKVQDITLADGTVQTYSDKPLHRLQKHIPMVDKAIEMCTLTSLVDYIKGNIDSMSDKMIIQVVDPETVVLFSQLNEERYREKMVVVKARIPDFRFDTYMDQENFCINLQSKFIDDPDTDRALILKFAGTMEAGTIAEYGDDGVTQKATVKTGIASKGEAIVPNPVKLRPYRTFLEVEQPASEFIFRVKQNKYDGISCAIFEADGGAWKIAATSSIKDYLQFELSGLDQFTVIS
jgi:hypothetical protein|uniref:Uncharacterized protein n=1 Tax=Siphoviridae sp. ctD6g5 TaxID=2826196 RepID=A0A8S5MS01_9CAUD|nr:MAG TPA: hypothetical protein [Siphoviridae sp. ctD6g5]